MYDIGKVGAGQRAIDARIIVQSRDAKIGHNQSPAPAAPPAVQLHFRNGIPSCRQFDIRRNAEIYQYLSAAAPHVKPPPIASSTTRSPRLMRPSRTAVSKASGTDAAEVLA